MTDWPYEEPADGIVTAEMLGARRPKDSVDFLGGERFFRMLPLIVRERLTCLCHIPYNQRATPEQPNGYLGYRTKSPSGTIVRTQLFHTVCLLPHRFSVRYVVLVCVECDQYYVPNPRNIREPRLIKEDGQWITRERYQICGACGG